MPKKITLTDVKEPNNIFEESGVVVAHIHERNYSNMERYPRPGRYIDPFGGIDIIDLERLYPNSNLCERITGFCAVCKQILNKEFPKDYPLEWKICCFCKKVAEWIVKGEFLEARVFKIREKKIRKLITLVGK